jgi:four helix bundle protein
MGKAHQLVLTSYRLTGSFPKQEMFGMTSQIRRGSLSMSANIAEGCGRMAIPSYIVSCKSPVGRRMSWSTIFLLARDLGYLPLADYVSVHKRLLEMKRMLVAFTKKVASERRA